MKKEEKIVVVVGVEISPVDHVKRETITIKQSVTNSVICG